MRSDEKMSRQPAVNRRGFLGLGLAALAASVAPSVLIPSAAEAAPFGGAMRRLSLLNINTRERFDDVYWADGRYRPDALRRLDVLLRDHKAGQVCRFDPKLFDLMWQLHETMGSSEPFEVLCGFRSRRTNALARRRSRGVAKESYHTRGMAVDIVLPDRSLKGLAEEAMRLEAGGVGYYPRSNFVHVDVGPVRTW